MYQDAKEELKRLEEALLEESEEAPETGEREEEREDDSQTYDTGEEKPMTGLLATVIALACGILAVLIFWFVRYGRVFL